MTNPGDNPEIFDVPVRDDSIRLGQFLKLADLAEDGGHARSVITDGDVQVNGEVETRRGRQLVDGDVIAIATPEGDRIARVVQS